MKTTQLANAVVNAQADALARQLDDGYLRIYGGSQPANANTAVAGQVLLVELRFANPSAPAASNGVITFAAFTAISAAATGTASWFRCLKSDGSSAVFDGSVDVPENNPNMSMITTAINAGELFVLASFSHTVAKATAGL